jgi:hypothetical protein
MSGLFFVGFMIAGPVLLFNGVVQFSVRKKTGPWKEGGGSLLAGAIIAGASIFLGWLTETWLPGTWWPTVTLWVFLISGLVLLFNGVVQLSVRKKTSPWKEGGVSLLVGASLLAGAIILGVSEFVAYLDKVGIWWSSLIVGLVLALNGVVQLSMRKKTGAWKEGRASLLAGAILVGVFVFYWFLGMLFLWGR